MQDNGQYQYVKLPDGSYGKFAANASDAYIHAQISKDFPKEMAAAQPPKPGFFKSLADSSGLTSLGNILMHPIDDINNVGGLLSDAAHGRPASDSNPITKGVRGIVNSVANPLRQSAELAKAGHPLLASANAVRAVPIIGPAMDAAGDQANLDPKKGYFGQLGQVVTNPSAMGSLAGGAFAAAPVVAGGIAAIGKDSLPAGVEGPLNASAGSRLLRSVAEKVPAPVADAVNALPSLPGIVGRSTGNALQEGGAGLINKAAGTLKSDFKFNANPGMGYLDGGGTPALTMRSLADKAGGVRSTAGSSLGSLYDSATDSGMTLDPDTVLEKVATPAAKLRATAEGFGGEGAPQSLDNYESQLLPAMTGGFDRGGFTPREVFDMKRSMAENTRWNDPTKFDLNTVRQQTTGALGGLLTEALPEAGPLNKVYQGANNLAARAELRANTGTPPFSSLVNRGLEGAAAAGIGMATHNPLLAAIPLAVDTVAAKTAAGYSMYKAGKLLAPDSGLLPPAVPPTPLPQQLNYPYPLLVAPAQNRN